MPNLAKSSSTSHHANFSAFLFSRTSLVQTSRQPRKKCRWITSDSLCSTNGILNFNWRWEHSFTLSICWFVVLGTSGIIKVWDVISGKLQTNIYVGSVILKMIWVSLSKARSALAVGLEDGSIFLYWYWPPSRLSKFTHGLCKGDYRFG